MKYHARFRLVTLWKICTSASRISPLRGSTVLGPTAFSVALGTHRTIDTFAFSPRRMPIRCSAPKLSPVRRIAENALRAASVASNRAGRSAQRSQLPQGPW